MAKFLIFPRIYSSLDILFALSSLGEDPIFKIYSVNSGIFKKKSTSNIINKLITFSI